MIAVSLDVGGGVRLIKPAKLSMCTQNTTKTKRGRTHGAGCVWQWFRTAEPQGERRYENWNKHTHISEAVLKKKIFEYVSMYFYGSNLGPHGGEQSHLGP